MIAEKYRDVRIEVAVREGTEFGGRLRVWGRIFSGAGTMTTARRARGGLFVCSRRGAHIGGFA
jgi:hypothetical protein